MSPNDRCNKAWHMHKHTQTVCYDTVTHGSHETLRASVPSTARLYTPVDFLGFWCSLMDANGHLWNWISSQDGDKLGYTFFFFFDCPSPKLFWALLMRRGREFRPLWRRAPGQPLTHSHTMSGERDAGGASRGPISVMVSRLQFGNVLSWDVTHMVLNQKVSQRWFLGETKQKTKPKKTRYTSLKERELNWMFTHANTLCALLATSVKVVETDIF